MKRGEEENVRIKKHWGWHECMPAPMILSVRCEWMMQDRCAGSRVVLLVPCARVPIYIIYNAVYMGGMMLTD